MPDELGTTGDIPTLGHTYHAEADIPDADTEKRAHQFANRCLTWGRVISVTTVIVALSAALLLSHRSELNSDARLFAGLAVVAAIAVGSGLVVVGSVNHLLNPLRTMGRLNSQQIERLASTMNGSLRQLQKLTDSMTKMEERLAAAEEIMKTVPSYGQGVIDGATMRRSVVGES